MRRFIQPRSTHCIFLPAFVALASSLLQACCGLAVARDFPAGMGNWPLTEIQFKTPDALPRTMVVRGTWPDTGRVAAVFASTGLFDVFVAALDDKLAREGEKINLENSEVCRWGGQTMLSDGIRLECIHRAESGLLPGCSIQVNLSGPPNAESVAQRARIFVVLDHGEPCPSYDQRYLAENLRMNGLRAWRTSRLLAEVPSPTPQSILHALGVQPSPNGH